MVFAKTFEREHRKVKLKNTEDIILKNSQISIRQAVSKITKITLRDEESHHINIKYLIQIEI